MARLIIRSTDAVKGIALDTRFGAYLLQSDSYPSMFRIGIAGARNKGTFVGRLQTHRRTPNDDNWTCRHRRWTALWTAEMQGGSQLCAQLAEHVLYAAFARRYRFVNDSGIETAAGGPALVAVANDTINAIVSIMRIQLDEPVELVWADTALLAS